MTFDGIPFNDTNDPTHHSWVFFPAQTIGSTVFDRSPGSAAIDRTVDLRRIGEPAVALAERRAGCSTGRCRTARSTRSCSTSDFNSGRFGAGRQVAPDVRRARDAVGRLPDVQLPEAGCVLGEVSVHGERQHVADARSRRSCTCTANTPNQKGSTRAQIAAVRRQLPDDRRSERRRCTTSSTSTTIPTDFEYVGVQDAARQRLVDRQQDLHDAVLQQAELQRRDDDLGDERHRQAEQLPEGRQQPAGDLRVGRAASSAPACGRSTRRPIAIRRRPIPRTWVDAALPNFHEMFGTTTLQPYAEYRGARCRT